MPAFLKGNLDRMCCAFRQDSSQELRIEQTSYSISKTESNVAEAAKKSHKTMFLLYVLYTSSSWNNLDRMGCKRSLKILHKNCSIFIV